MTPEDQRADTARPFTGAEYLETLRDGRQVFIDGEQVDDVTRHPAFANSARSIARLYDALHDDDTHAVLTTDTASGGGYTHRAFRPARSAEDMALQRDAIAAWARLTYGWMGRTPDFKAALVNSLGANAAFYGDFAHNARAWYRRAQEAVLFINHAIVNPPVDRSRPADTIRDVCVSIDEEVDGGVIVSGAKVVATGAAISQYSFVGQSGPTASDDKDLAVQFVLPVSAKGCKLICRTSYERYATQQSTAFDYPLSSRFDENDAIFVLDRAFVPWENVLVHRDIERMRRFYVESGFMQGFCLQGCTRLAVKLDFMAGLVARALQITGGDIFRGNQVHLGEIVSLRNMLWAFSDAMVGRPDPWVDGSWLPNLRAASAYRALAPDAFSRVREIVHKIVASALIYLPSSVHDLHHPEIDRYLATYVRGSGGIGHRERIKVMKLLWDAVGSEFGGRHELYERNYAGNHEEVRLAALRTATSSGELDAMAGLVQRCLDDYDEHGWIDHTWPSFTGQRPAVALS
jgi:4-hydroxyphenylacetate 3-monooxygenase